MSASAAFAESQSRTDARSHALWLLSHFPAGQHLELRAFSETDRTIPGSSYWIENNPLTRGAQLEAALNWADVMSQAGRGIYAGMNPRPIKPCKKETMTHLVACYADLDTYKVGKTHEDLAAFLDSGACPLQPSYVAHSGGGLQVIYFLKPTEDKEAWQTVQEKLAVVFKAFGADRAVVTDWARVLRLTPYPNQKIVGSPRATAIIRVTDREPMEIQEMVGAFAGVEMPAPEVKCSTGTVRQVPEDIPEGGMFEMTGRNATIFAEAMRLFKTGYRREEIQPLMEMFNDGRCKPPLDMDELNAVLDNVCKYEGGTITVTQPEDYEDLVEPFEDFDRKEFAEGEYVLRGLYPGEIGGLVSMPNLGKSTLVVNAALSLAAGREYPMLLPDIQEGETRRPRRVAILDFENRSFFFQNDVRKMTRMNFDTYEQGLIKKNLFVCVDKEIAGEPLCLSNPTHLFLIKKKLEKFNPDLIIVDTLSEAFNLASEADNREMLNVVVKPMKDLAKSCKAVVLIVHHVGKKGTEGGGDPGMFAARGASSFSGAVRAQWNLAPVRQGGDSGDVMPGYVKLICTKIKGVTPEPITLKQDFDRRFFETTEQQVTQSEQSGILAILRCLDRELSPSQLLAACEVAKVSASLRGVARALEFGLKTGLVAKPKHGVYVLTNKGMSELRPVKADAGNVVEMPQGGDRPRRAEEDVPLSVGQLVPISTASDDPEPEIEDDETGQMEI